MNIKKLILIPKSSLTLILKPNCILTAFTCIAYFLNRSSGPLKKATRVKRDLIDLAWS